MSDGITLLTIEGIAARILKLIIATPLLAVGGWVLYWGRSEPTLLIIGAVLALGGLASLYSALTDDEVRISIGGSSGSFE